jgi:hypothetical protein
MPTSGHKNSDVYTLLYVSGYVYIYGRSFLTKKTRPAHIKVWYFDKTTELYYMYRVMSTYMVGHSWPRKHVQLT